jgi:hypothetical protein
MPPTSHDYRPLQDDQIQALRANGCTAEDWTRVKATALLQVDRVRNTHFVGDVQIGSLDGVVAGGAGIDKPAGLFNALIANCTIGNGTRIANVGVHLANYDIGEGVSIEDVGTLETRTGATFGNGVEIEVLNEGGGRELILFNTLSAQVAHLTCLHRYRPEMVARLTQLARDAAARVASDRGQIGRGAQITSVGEMVDVNVGPHARLTGCGSLLSGTILSSGAAPTVVGSGVQADDFIIGEGSQVTGAAVVSKTFVGQGCQIGKQFSTEGSAWFANCEAFHGEACSLLAGPYTVTHHKSTLLIAALMSFYNAGSGTNQSNHMYKLGPLHEGKLERGCKTGSFSYMMWPCRVGPFSVILGKHKGTIDTADFPFSIIDAAPDGRAHMIPGLNLATVGTIRDGAKWPLRDRRQGSVRRDRITFDVLSPLTVGRMLTGVARLKELQESTDRSVDSVAVGGTLVKRVLLRSGQKFYRSGIEVYLLERVVDQIEKALADGATSLSAAVATAPAAVFSQQWIDVGGQLMPRDRLEDLARQIASGGLADLEAVEAQLDAIDQAYRADEWRWVKTTYQQVFGVDLDQAGKDQLKEVAQQWAAAKTRFLNRVLADATKEFDDLSHTGFGQDGGPEDAARDFDAVRGGYDGNRFVKELRGTIQGLDRRATQFQESLDQVG